MLLEVLLKLNVVELWKVFDCCREIICDGGVVGLKVMMLWLREGTDDALKALVAVVKVARARGTDDSGLERKMFLDNNDDGET